MLQFPQICLSEVGGLEFIIPLLLLWLVEGVQMRTIKHFSTQRDDGHLRQTMLIFFPCFNLHVVVKLCVFYAVLFLALHCPGNTQDMRIQSTSECFHDPDTHPHTCKSSCFYSLLSCIVDTSCDSTLSSSVKGVWCFQWLSAVFSVVSVECSPAAFLSVYPSQNSSFCFRPWVSWFTLL